MKKVFKYSIYGLAGLVLLLVLSVLLVVNIVDLNTYKDKIEDLATEQVGREVKIGGDIGFSLFPWIGVDLQKVSLANKKGFEREYLARVESLGVEVKLLPLLFREVRVGGVKINGFTLNLSKKESGETNWEGLGGKKKAANATQGKEKKQPASMPDISVQEVVLGSGTVNWLDQSSNTELNLHDFDLRAGPLQMGEFFPFKFGFGLDNNTPQVSLDAKGSGRIRAELDREKFTLRDFELDSSFQGEAVPSGKGELNTSLDAGINLQAGNASVQNLALSSYGLDITGAATGKNLLQGPQLSGEIKIAEFSPMELMRRLGEEPPKTRDKEVLESFRMQVGFEKDGDSIRVRDLSARLDDTSINGQVSVQNPDNPKIDLNMQLGELNADRYLPPAGEKKEQKETGGSSGEKESPIPSELIREQDIKGQIDMEKFTVQEITMHNLGLTLSVQDGIARINPLKADLYQGSLRSRATLDVRKKTPRMQFKQQMKQVDMQPLLIDAAGMGYIKGKADVDADIATKGEKSKDWLENSNGEVSLSMQDGSIQGLNLVQLLYNKIRTIQGKNTRSAQENETDFSKLDFRARIRDGTVRESNLSLVSPLLELDGSGKIDLVKRSFDYSFRAGLTEKFVQETGTELKQVSSTEIPISLQGPLSKPGYNIDIEKAVKDMGKKEIRDQIQERFLDKLGGGKDKKEQEKSGESGAKELLEGLF